MKSKLAASDLIFIKKLVVPAVIGVLPEEQKSPQDLILDLDMVVDIREAAKDDDLRKTVDYAEVRRSMIHFLEESSFELLETCADRLAAYLLEHFTIQSLRLSITKRPFDIADAEGVGVVVTRGENPYYTPFRTSENEDLSKPAIVNALSEFANKLWPQK